MPPQKGINMKTSIFFIALIVLALFFLLWSVGADEAGLLSSGAFLCCSGGSVAVMWAAGAAIDKIERGESKQWQQNRRDEQKTHTRQK